MRPSIGRIVHFVMPEGSHRPAMIVSVYSETCVNLQVFIDGRNDVPDCRPTDSTIWQTSVHHSDEKSPRTWHWPEREEPQTISGAGGINAREESPEPAIA